MIYVQYITKHCPAGCYLTIDDFEHHNLDDIVKEVSAKMNLEKEVEKMVAASKRGSEFTEHYIEL